MRVFDFHKWPLGSQELGLFGNSELEELVCNYLDHLFDEDRKKSLQVTIL